MRVIGLILLVLLSLPLYAGGYQKPGADFRWQDESRLEPNTGESVTLKLQLLSSYSEGMARIHLLPSEGLASQDFGRVWEIDLAREALILETEFIAEREGRNSIGVLIEYQGQTRVLAKAVYVGGYEAWQMSKRKRKASAVRSMQAQEQIR
jgi:hypothetical protein